MSRRKSSKKRRQQYWAQTRLAPRDAAEQWVLEVKHNARARALAQLKVKTFVEQGLPSKNSHPRAWVWSIVALTLPLALVAFFDHVPIPHYLSWGSLNDYYYDAGPAVLALAHGHLAFWTAHSPAPAMLPETVLIRGALLAPLIQIFRLGATGRYVITMAILVALSTLILALALQRIYKVQGRRLWTACVSCVILILYPLSAAALYVGHPEEVFGSALLLLAAIFLGQAAEGGWAEEDGSLRWGGLKREWKGISTSFARGAHSWLVPSLTVALAMSVKQDFWVAAPALLLICPPAWRWRMVATTLLVGVVLALPGIWAGGPGSLFGGLGDVTFTNSIGFTPITTAWLLLGDPHIHLALSINRPVLALCALLLPLIVWLRRRGKGEGSTRWSAHLNLSQALLLVGAVMVLRTLLDVDPNDYYHLAAFLCLAGAEASWALRVRYNRDFSWRHLYRVPIPWFSLIWGALVYILITGNRPYTSFLYNALHTNQFYIVPAMYALFCLAPLFIAVRVLCWPNLRRPLWSIRYQWVGAFTAFAVLIPSLTALGGPSAAPLLLPDNFYTNLPAMRSLAAHENLYWLGPDTSSLLIPLPGTYHGISSIVIYRLHPSLFGHTPYKPGYASQVSIDTENIVLPELPALIRKCKTTPVSCPQNVHLLKTPIGEGLAVIYPNPTGWEIDVLVGPKKTVLVQGVNIIGGSQNVESVANLLRQITPSQLG